MQMKTGKLTFFNSMTAVPARSMVLARLGHRKNKTVLKDSDRQVLEKGIRKALMLCDTHGAALRLPIISNDGSSIELDKGIVIESAGLAGLLKNSTEAVLMASTVGRKVVDAVLSEIEDGSAALGVVMDAYAAQKADAGLDWIMDYVRKVVVREGGNTTKHRYSPGYGDLGLEYQKVFFELLDLSRMGLSLTEKNMLVPEKSVIAVAGIERTEVYEKGRIQENTEG